MMQSFRRVAAVAIGASAFAWGCGGGPEVTTSSEEATVSGTVIIQGEPPKEAEIVFDPSNVKRRDAAVRTAPIGDDGSYTITTLVGDNVVTFSGPITSRNQGLGTTRLPFRVEPGENTFNITLPENDAP